MLHLKNPVEADGGGSAGAGAGAGAGSSGLGSTGKVVLQRGRIVHLDESKMEDVPSGPAPPRCTHGPRGACDRCRPAEPEGKAADLEWMCRHPPHQMCVNCAPLVPGAKVKLAMLCAHGPTGKCSNCIDDDKDTTRKHISFEEFMADRKKNCKHDGFSATCMYCMPPSEVSYAMKANCPRHKPYPLGLCTDCRPPNVVLARQKYRHVERIQIQQPTEFASFVALWQRTHKQRVGFLYGSYKKDDSMEYGVKAVVEAVYEPPQRCTATDFVLPADPMEATVNRVAEALGLSRIGVVFMEPETPHCLSSERLRAISRLQSKYRTPDAPGSRFVTLAMTYKDDGSVEPKGYMAADMLVAMERANILTESPAPQLFKVKEPAVDSREFIPDVIRNDAKLGASNVKEFEVEFLLVQMEVSTAAGAARAGQAPVLKKCVFPVENRERVAQTPADLKDLLSAREPLHSSLADFHALLYMASRVDVESAELVAQCIRTGSEVPDGIAVILSSL